MSQDISGGRGRGRGYECLRLMEDHLCCPRADLKSVVQILQSVIIHV